MTYKNVVLGTLMLAGSIAHGQKLTDYNSRMFDNESKKKGIEQTVLYLQQNGFKHPVGSPSPEFKKPRQMIRINEQGSIDVAYKVENRKYWMMANGETETAARTKARTLASRLQEIANEEFEKVDKDKNYIVTIDEINKFMRKH